MGERGEDLAAARYRRDGYEVVDRNWSCPAGELDLVLLMGGPNPSLVFVEVKARSSERFGTPAEAVTIAKRRRVRRAAGAWLAAHPAPGHRGWGPVRFDVATVTGNGSDTVVEIFPHAF